MNAPRIEFVDVWKRLARRQHVSTLGELLMNAPRLLTRRRNAEGLHEHEFWALKGASFTLQPGDMLGVIGPNGAGKSSILKLISRIFRPDRGRIAVNGRVTGLIELGAGFHPMLSGRENVFINGAILGMKQGEVRSKYDSIVEFAEVGEFMDMPVKNFSSGMYARLAFSIAAHAEPDVLLVDEVLAVGDEPFQKKCYAWVEEMRSRGCAVVLVSHNLDVVKSASHCMYLVRGQVRTFGSPAESIAAYRADQSLQADAAHARVQA